MRRTFAWLIFLGTLASVLVVAIPMWLIQPFRAQSPGGVAWSYMLRGLSPGVTLIATALVVILTAIAWRTVARRRTRFLLSLGVVLSLLASFVARQNHFEWMFAPLREKVFVAANEVDFLADDDMVLAVTIGTESVAYPVRQLAYNHVVQDIVAGTPVVATY